MENLLVTASRVLRAPEGIWSADAPPAPLLRPLPRLLLVSVVGFFLYGAATGSYVGGRQIGVTGCKVPALFFGTLGVCLLALHVLNLSGLLGVTVSLRPFVRTVGTSAAASALALAALSPIVWLFSVTLVLWVDEHYTFLVLLTTAFVGLGGLVGVLFLYRGLRAEGIPRRPAIRLIVAWTLVYQFVGAQMTWLLRPFVGSSQDTIRFEGNFYEALPILLHRLVERLTDF